MDKVNIWNNHYENPCMYSSIILIKWIQDIPTNWQKWSIMSFSVAWIPWQELIWHSQAHSGRAKQMCIHLCQSLWLQELSDMTSFMIQCGIIYTAWHSLSLSLGGQGLYPSDLLTHEVPHRLPLRQIYQVYPHHQVSPMGYAILWILWLYDLDNHTNVDTTSAYGWVALHHHWFHIVLHNILPFCSMWFCWCFSASEEWILVSKCEVHKMLILIQFHKLTGKVRAYLVSHTTSYLG